MPRSQRVTLLVENFYQDFMSGMTRYEIEEKYGVSKGYSLNFLEEIAKKNGVDSEIFFQMAHGPHVMTDKTGRIIPPKKYSNVEIEALFNEGEALLTKTASSMNEMLEDMSALLEEWSEEFKEKL